MKTIKFTRAASENPPDILQGKTIQEFLNNEYTEWQGHNLQHYGHYKLQGWQFDFTEDMQRFYLSDSDCDILKVYAPDINAVYHAYPNAFDVVQIP